MFIQHKRAVLAFLLLTFSSSTAFAVKGDVCNYGDKNGNLREPEIRVFVMHQQSDIYRNYDVNCDGRLSPAELARYEADQQPLIDEARYALARIESGGQNVHVDEK